MIKKLRKAYTIHKLISRLSDTQKTSLFRMLYWKITYALIPKTEYHILIGDKWLIETDKDGSYTWSDEAIRISNLF